MLLKRKTRAALLAWFRFAQRDLPWRATRDPYRIWVSEIMLQQTRAAAAIPYYERFLARFPTLERLAAAREEEVLAAWAGLGYYSRARNLLRAARTIVDELGGAFPRSFEAIRALAGIGDYTAGAVASIAFGIPRAAVDGNVLRVLSRLAAEPGDIAAPVVRKRLAAAAAGLLDRAQAGEWNQAVMELGATVCLPRTPQCPRCPLSPDCRARALGQPLQFPVRLRRPVFRETHQTIAVIQQGKRILFRRRPAAGVPVAGFWELPTAESLGGFTASSVLGSFRHTITTNRFTITVVAGTVRRVPKGYAWLDRDRLEELPLSTAARKALALLR